MKNLSFVKECPKDPFVSRWLSLMVEFLALCQEHLVGISIYTFENFHYL